MRYFTAAFFLLVVAFIVGATTGPHITETAAYTTTSSKYVINSGMYTDPTPQTITYIRPVDGTITGAGYRWTQADGWFAVTDTFTVYEGDYFPVSGKIDIINVKASTGTVNATLSTYWE